MATRKDTKTERLDIRISPAAKRRILRAAALANCSLTEFVESRVCAAADRMLREHDTLRLHERDRDLFLALLLKPPKPTPALRKAVQRYQKLKG